MCLPAHNGRTMPLLRNTRRLARLLLACFALSLGVAMVSPMVQPQRGGEGDSAGMWDRICTASGDAPWVAANAAPLLDADTAPHHPHGLDCVLCLPPLLPTLDGPAPLGGPAPGPVFQARSLRLAHVPALSRAPFPPRAPPWMIS